MIQAETAYNIVQALTPEELARLCGMMQVEPINKPTKKKVKVKKICQVEAAGWTVENVIEKLLISFINKAEKR
ncbi:hypothetical protein [Flavobacterium cerinum]|uniref:Uncharacterized protein n=1 Tax=Flavobacterium cerinum TaxID=2502784 RepID=A0ABY5IW41_9FLAO|nr:hypothetical protein [Flavobacterium cerinum]UUC45559.1 hypothetical protein NOX80_18305 [Flavobacterium cerinum]